jgi:DNA-binding NarL/FixJ family response regulator
VRVAFIDDFPIFLTGVTLAFSNVDDIEIVAVGQSLDDAVRIASNGGVDVLVMEIALRGEAFATIRSITGAPDGPRVVVLTGAPGIDAAIQAFDSGASGFLTKRSPLIEVQEAIRAAAAGETFIAPGVASQVIGALRGAAARKQVAASIKLSTREQQITRLLLRGRTNKEIARQLALSDKTVKSYMANLMQKLDCRNRTEVALAAQTLGSTSHVWN